MSNEWDEVTSAVAPPSQTPGSQGRAYLVVLQGANVGEMYQVASDEMVIGRGAGTDIRLNDDGISRFHCKVRRTDSGVEVEDLDSRNGTYRNGEKVKRCLLNEGDKLQIGSTSVLRFTFHDKMDESFQRRMFDAALRDSLTRAYNKRYLLDRLHSELRFALRHKSRLSLIFMDLDHFKAVNDRHGHLVGDQVLSAFADDMHDRIRHEDVFARFGGEEFVVLSREINAADTLHVADRLRRSVSEARYATDAGPLAITVSVGVVTLEDVRIETASGMLVAADTALYQAKSSGRNRTVVCTPEMLASARPRQADDGTEDP